MENKSKLESSLNNKINTLNRKCFIYGAGNTSLLYGTESFEKTKLNIEAFIDGNPQKIGTTFLNKPVISLDECLKKYENPLVFVNVGTTKTINQVTDLLKEKHVEHYILDKLIFTQNKDKILDIYNSLGDDLSKETYANIILARMNESKQDFSLVKNDQYFDLPEFRQNDPNEIFVDCGAYVGDTIEKYLFIKQGIFKQIYAFEPEQRNFEALNYRTDRLNKEWALSSEKIKIINAAVSDIDSQGEIASANQDSPSLGAKITQNNNGSIPIIKLDSFFSNKKITFLKADIESYEQKLLLGARNIISRDKPLLAICIYHNAYDMFEITLLIKEINPNYKMYIRQHYYGLSDTIIYSYE
jgi:FkbM family methyltransferase